VSPTPTESLCRDLEPEITPVPLLLRGPKSKPATSALRSAVRRPLPARAPNMATTAALRWVQPRQEPRKRQYATSCVITNKPWGLSRLAGAPATIWGLGRAVWFPQAVRRVWVC